MQLTLVFLMCICLSTFSTSLAVAEAQGSVDLLVAVTNSVKEVCQAPSKEGRYWTVEGDGSGGGKLTVRLADANIQGRAQFTKGEWEGVQQVLKEHQIEDNRDYRGCVKALTPLFIGKFVPLNDRPSIEILSFDSTRDSVKSGEPVTLKWATQNAERCTLEKDYSYRLWDVQTNGLETVKPTGNTTFTLTCFGTGGLKTQELKVNVVPQPAARITSFAADVSNVRAGNSVVLRWKSENSRRCSLEESISREHWDVTVSGSKTFRPRATTNYTLACIGENEGEDSRDITITVYTPPPVRISRFTCSRNSITRGHQVTLRWTTENAIECTLKDDIYNEAEDVDTSGSKRINPSETTTYTLTCTGEGDSASREINVDVGGTGDEMVSYCCDLFGNRRCIINPTPNGSPCFCFGQGQGVACE